MRSRWSSGTPPRSTSRSVPRLTAENRVRTSTSPGPGSGSRSDRSSATPGPVTQSARAVAVTVCSRPGCR